MCFRLRVQAEHFVRHLLDRFLMPDLHAKTHQTQPSVLAVVAARQISTNRNSTEEVQAASLISVRPDEAPLTPSIPSPRLPPQCLTRTRGYEVVAVRIAVDAQASAALTPQRPTRRSHCGPSCREAFRITSLQHVVIWGSWPEGRAPCLELHLRLGGGRILS